MNHGQRRSAIIRLLAQQREFLTADDIADALGVSTRTIYRDIAHLNRRSKILDVVPSKGIRLDYGAYLESSLGEGTESGMQSLSIEQRRHTILAVLLATSPQRHSLASFADLFYVSVSSIHNDVKHLGRLLDDDALRIDSTSEGTTLLGTESALRSALVRLVNPLISGGPGDDTGEAILATLREQGIFSARSLESVVGALEESQTHLDIVIEEPYYVNIVIHLLVMIERARTNFMIEGEEPTFPGWSKVAPDEDRGQGHEKYRRMVEQVLTGLAAQLHIAIPAREYLHLYDFVLGSQDEAMVAMTTDHGEPRTTFSREVAAALIAAFQDALGQPVAFDEQLTHKLVQHLTPMLYRTQNEIELINPLAGQISEQFPDTSSALARAAERVAARFSLKPIPPSEMGYLTLYFQRALDRARDRLRVLIVCSTGRGTSQFLRGRVEHAFPTWQVVDVTSSRAVREQQEDAETSWAKVDLIISTLPLDAPAPVAVVSALFTDNDAAIVRQVLARAHIGQVDHA